MPPSFQNCEKSVSTIHMQATAFVVSCYTGCKRLRLSTEKNKGMDFSSRCQDEQARSHPYLGTSCYAEIMNLVWFQPFWVRLLLKSYLLNFSCTSNGNFNTTVIKHSINDDNKGSLPFRLWRFLRVDRLSDILIHLKWRQGLEGGSGCDIGHFSGGRGSFG